MKIFISWSGEPSRHIAEALRDGLPDLLQSVKPWCSSHDIVPGAHWASELAEKLATSSFGILCITKENLKSPWLLFEAGSLAKQIKSSFVVPYLIDVTPADVQFPLAQFQGVEANEAGTRTLMRNINQLQGEPLSEERFKRAFEKWWPDFKTSLDNRSEKVEIKGSVRSDRDIIEELLGLARVQYRTNLRPVSSIAPDARSKRQGTRALIYWHEEGLTFEAARELVDILEKHGIQTILAKHRDPRCPDAIFIGALVGAEDARLVLANIPYKVQYIFRQDYPASLGGDDSGFMIGIGYMANHPQVTHDETSRPVQMSSDVMQKLSDPSLSNTKFQMMLRDLAFALSQI
jgi:hypothetical protein